MKVLMIIGEYWVGISLALLTIPALLVGALWGAGDVGSYLRTKNM